jgi:putative endonuclease
LRGKRGLGDAGERLALARLRELGYEPVESNWRCARGEIDLVMRDGATLVFVEVRTRRGEALGTPEESVNAAKQRRLAELALLWLAAHHPDGDGPEWRIDVVAVRLAPSGALRGIAHLPNAVESG